MELKLVRKINTSKSTVGDLFIDEVFFCHTLEDEDKLSKGLPKIFGLTAIPKGKYGVIINRSNRFSALTKKDVFLPLLLNVPEYEGVRIHGGNKPEDTEGCILVGMTYSPETPDFISISRIALQKLMDRLKGQTNITIEIV